MKISTQVTKFLNQHYGSAGDPAADGIDALVQSIGASLAAVEEVIDLGKRYEQVVVVKVVSCQDHPNADRLHECWIDDGGKVEGVERNDKGLVHIVCGAPNVHEGMLAAWLPPGSTVPATIDKEPFVLEAREIRGVVSNGMLASPKELGLSDNHEGILEITENFEQVVPGTPFGEAMHLKDDYTIDMENKMFTHRPDCFGWLGIARELEGIAHRPYKSPGWYVMSPDFPGPETDELKLEIRNELPDLVPRFSAVVMSNIKVEPSPSWLQVDLARMGMRSVNNIVDYTNYYMLLTGQPMHAYDYDKVTERSQGDGAVIVVRKPNKGEKITLLTGKVIEPRDDAIMIATDKELIGVGGVMGGGDTEVDESTKNIIIECANFDMYSIRRTSMAHGLFTDAVTRFNKGQSLLQNLACLAKIVNHIQKYSGGKVAGSLIDINNVPKQALERGNLHAPVTVTTQFINERLGWSLSADDMSKLLTNVEFKVEVASLQSPVSSGDDQRLATGDQQLTVHAPFWRTDIEIPEDVVEEVGRLNGYDKLPLDLPRRDITPAVKNPSFELQASVRQLLSAAGANELLTYSFVHGDLMDKVGQNRDEAFQVSNALSPDLQYYRLSVTPSLLERVHPNIKAGYGEFALFESGRAHGKSAVDDEGLPRELSRFAFVFAADGKTAAETYTGAAYYEARKYLMHLLNHFGLLRSFTWKPLTEADFGGYSIIEQMTKPFEPNRSAVLVKDDLVIGVVGEYRVGVRKALKLPAFSAGFELFHSALASGGASSSYVQLPRFPKVEQDICLKVPAATTYHDVYEFVWSHVQEKGIDNTFVTIKPVDIYQREDDKDHKQITLRLSVASYERTLTDAEVSKLLDEIAATAKDKLQAERI